MSSETASDKLLLFPLILLLTVNLAWFFLHILLDGLDYAMYESVLKKLNHFSSCTLTYFSNIYGNPHILVHQ
jgi:predicted DNA repair protein MutK